MNRANGQSGLTLVELVAATTVTVLVAGSTAGILRSTAAARQRVNRQMSLQQEARLAVNTIATALRNAYRADGDQAVLEGTEDRLGEFPADRVRFFTVSRTTVRRGQPESDVKECEFFLSAPADGRLPALMQRLDPTLNEPPDGGGVLRRVAADVLGLEIAYHDGRQWQPEWPKDANRWPVAVRIRLAVLAEAAEGPRGPGGSQNVWTTSRIVNFPRRPAEKESNKQ